jgi:hypothetical protein
LFHLLMRPHIRKILKEIDRPVDIVWSFDLGNLYPFSLFPSPACKIFHPVDEPLNQTAIDSAKGAGAIFSVTKEILAKYSDFDIPKYFINHGIADEFLEPFAVNTEIGHPIRVGFSGNLLRNDIESRNFIRMLGQL